MRRSSAIKFLLLGAVGLGGVGFSGGCGSETTPQAGTSVKEDVQKTNERQKFIEDQYKKK